ncbi:hypothetical protein [Salisediminibacterium halotolerans]|uniref:hypothetical protein n=1 Tax=Salisediminibacterium halotolerans TaxID=517425 RepID=UPI000F2BBEE1|nr:hypothetical protein [Salisediminibacterium halotolerans]RLJ80899.1 hypothetical protein BCL39_0206 [Actinophytocola xinjiangensis]RPE83914.1 hypothetical protein EDD67_2473 [Salisediminibacterium halotolerans]TWG37842.1 hypothetical protein BCL52_0205 [Salisediminibacterium halotolerans]GEL08701.1 hypothetical protein SHA02_21170 [Salisediminibacterium halotolerans]
MVQAFIFAVTIFLGWIIFDGIKHKKILKENVFAGLITGVTAGVFWYILFIIF